jgi:hypothetical protein
MPLSIYQLSVPTFLRGLEIAAELSLWRAPRAFRLLLPYSAKSQCSLTTSWPKLRFASLDRRRKPARS